MKPGDSVDVLIEKTEDREGYVVLSKEKAEKMKIWDDVERAYQERRVVVGRVIERVKGGLAVDIGVRAFLPGSQVDIRPVRNLDALKGQELRMRVIKVNKKRGNIVLSRKAVLEEENAERKTQTLETLEEGKVLTGTVKNITEYGAFVDLGGIDGLLHITDMSWGRINHPCEMLQVGDDVRVVVLKFDRECERVSLGFKQLQEDPWESATIKYPAHPSQRQGRQPDRLRRLRRGRGGRRRPHPRLRDVVDEGVKHPSKILRSVRRSSASVLESSTRKGDACRSASSRPSRTRGS